MKKVLSLFLAFVFVMSICAVAPITANAASLNDLIFELNEDGKSYSVSAGNLRMEGDLVIPNEYNNLPVTEIARTGFQFCSLLESVKFPETLKKINLAAFDNCARISEVTIPASVEFIDGAVFSSIYDLNEIKVESGNKYYKSVDGILYNTDMTELLDYPPAKEGDIYTLPQTVTKIAGWCFSNNRYLTTIKLNDNIKTIEEGTFAYCRSLENLELGNSVTKIGANSIRDCNKIVSFDFPNSIKVIDSFAFFDCGGLKNVEIPEKVTVIKDFSFASCTSLESVTIPSGVVSIEEGVFANDSNLKTVKFKGTVAQWNLIIIEPENNADLLKANIEFVPGTDTHKHNYKGTITKQPTCTEKGVKTFTCSCGDSYKEVIEEKEHNWNNGDVIAKPNCVETGGEIFTCTDCGSLKTESIPALGHKSSNWIIDKQPTAKENGSKHKECTVCKVILETAIIEKNTSLATPVATTKNSAKGIEVNWNAIENAESYIVYRSVLSGSNWSKWSAIKKGVTTTSYVDTTVKLGTKYKYTVRAVNGDVMSKYVGTTSSTYNVTPTVKVAVASNGIKVSWSTAANATGYTVYKSEYNSKTKKWSNWKTMGTVKASKTSWTDKSVKSGTQYKYTIRAVNGKVLSSYNKTGAATLYLAQPTVKIASASTGVKVSWNKVTGATGYTVYRSEYKNGAWTKWASRGTAKANKTSWTDTKVASGVQYKYTVRAINGKVASTYVSSNTILYLAQPKTTVKAVSNGINVAWTQSTGATGYTVYRMEYNTKTKKWSGWKKMGTAKSSKTNWTDKSAKKGVQYKYTVKAVNGKTASTYKSSASIKR